MRTKVNGSRRMNLVPRPKRSLRFGLLSLLTVTALQLFSVPAQARPLDPISKEEVDARIQSIQYTPWKGKASETRLSDWYDCRRSVIDIPVHNPETKRDENLRVTLFYKENIPQPLPLLIVIPTSEGQTVPEPTVAVQVCHGRMAGMIADVNANEIPEQVPDWDFEDRNNRRAIRLLRSLIDYAQTDARFDSNRIGMMGISLGGITTAMMAGIEPERLKAAVITVGAGNLPHILSNTQVVKLAQLRMRRMEYLGITSRESYEEEVRKHLKLDPEYFASRANPDRLMMVLAKEDSAVPYADQFQLWNLLDQPDSLTYNGGGHIDTIFLAITRDFMQIFDFLQDRFNR